MNDTCPSAEKCPIFNGFLKDKQMTTKLYRRQFCEGGEAGRALCKRWQCKQRFGKVPESILPNSAMRLEDIARVHNLM